MGLKLLNDTNIIEIVKCESTGCQVKNKKTVVSEPKDGVEHDLDKIYKKLNDLFQPYSCDLKQYVVSSVMRIETEVIKALKNIKEMSNNDKIQYLAEVLSVNFDKLSRRLDSKEMRIFCKHPGSKNKTQLLELVEEYIHVIFYKDFSELITPAQSTIMMLQLNFRIEVFSKVILPKDLELRLRMEDVYFQGFIPSATRNLMLLDSQKSPQAKMNLIHKCGQTLVLVMVKSSNYNKSLSTKDILPALIYIIIKSNVANFQHQLAYIFNFLAFRQNLEVGGAAYFLTHMLLAWEVIKLGFFGSPPEISKVTEISTLFDLASTKLGGILEQKILEDELKIYYLLKAFYWRNYNLISRIQSERTEKKYWNVIKWVPGVNVGYGTIRSIVYGSRRNKKEAISSVVGAVGGALGVGVGIAGGLVGGPIIVPIIVSMVSGTAANQLVTGGGELLYDAIEEPDSFLSLSPDDKEKEFYEKILRDIALVGGIYSVVRSAVYLAKDSKKEAISSGIAAGVNIIPSMCAVGVGVGVARLASSLVSTVGIVADDVARPIVNEAAESIAEVGIKQLNLAARSGTGLLTKIVLEKARDFNLRPSPIRESGISKK